MSIETMKKPVNLPDNEKGDENRRFPFETENRTIDEYKTIFETGDKNKIILQENKLNNIQQAFDNFFRSHENSSEVIFKADCKKEIISVARDKTIDFLQKKAKLTDGEAESLRLLIGDIVADTLHSQKQIIGQAEFYVKLNILGNKKYSFEIINEDRVKFKDWPILFDTKDIIEAYGKIGGGAHLGTRIKLEIIKELHGKAKYIAINNKKGGKEYTSFYFEKK